MSIRRILLPAVLGLSMMTAPGAGADPSALSVDPESTAGQAIIAPALVSLTGQLQAAATLNVHSLRATDGWAFLYAKIQGPGGQRFDYSVTPFAEAAAAGGKSWTYVALLQHAGGWRVVQDAVGPTDVAWGDWAAKYGAPSGIFDIPQD